MRTFRNIIVAVAFLFSGALVAQEQKPEPKFEKQEDLVRATFYYEDGTLSQEGTYKGGKLHGEWVSYNREGEKNAIAKYSHGEKTGKWFFWTGDKLNEVNYDANRIVSVSSWKNDGILVSNN